MNEEMTDEQIEADIEGALLGYVRCAQRLKAHIAALATERDAAVKREKTTRESIRETHLDMDNARCPGTNRPIEERIRLLWEERDALRERVESLDASRSEFFNRAQSAKVELADECKAHMRTQEEVRALRERVKALEAELALMKERATNSEKGRERAREVNAALQTRLAAIRTTARTLQSMSLSTVMDGEWNRQASALIREMAGDDARPSAPPEAFTHEKGLDAGVFDEAPEETKAARLIREEREAAAEMVRRAAAPTTSEAFAALRVEWSEATNPVGVPSSGRFGAMLSLLERRMGAMGLKLSELREKVGHTLACLAQPCDAACICDAALTDAPAVLTLEQAKALETRLGGEVPNPGEQYLSGWLDALNTFVQELERLTAMRK